MVRHRGVGTRGARGGFESCVGRAAGGLALVVVLSAVGAARASNYDAADTINALGFLPGNSYGYNLTGAGVTVALFEAGSSYLVRDTHQDFRLPDGTSRVTLVPNSSTSTISYSGHATGVAGTVGGAGVAGTTYRGMAPDVRIRSYGSSSFSSFFPRDATLFDLSNHSYSDGDNAWATQTWTLPDGTTKDYRTWYDSFTENSATVELNRNTFNQDPRYGRYNSSSRSTDQVLFANPRVLSFWSAGNGRGSQYSDLQSDGKYVARFSTGFTPVNGVSLGNRYWLISTADYPAPGGSYDGMMGLQTAKNGIRVGAALEYTSDPHPSRITTNLLSSFTNFGPTDDGRLGVTLMANGTFISTADADSDTDYASSVSGTSYSSPSAAGGAAIILQHWRSKLGAGRSPLAATQKALLVHTTTDMVIAPQEVGPDYRTGYGMMDCYKAVKLLDDATQANEGARKAHVFETSITSNGRGYYYFLAVPGQDVRVTLVWDDPAGTTYTGFNNRTFRALVNDLDLSLTAADGTTYFPWTLNPDDPSAGAVRTTRNDVDNIEQVFVEADRIPGFFTVNLSTDGALQGGLPQNYSLIVSGATLRFVTVPAPTALAWVGVAGLMLGRRRRTTPSPTR